jgi:hypothetical protein
MDVATVIADSLPGWQYLPPPADPADIGDLASSAPIHLPSEYLDLLRLHDGGEGELGANPGWFQLWPASKVLEYNQGYELPKCFPGYFGFGSSGGGDLLGFDCRGSEPWPVITAPLIGLDPVEEVAESFGAFVRLLGRRFIRN